MSSILGVVRAGDDLLRIMRIDRGAVPETYGPIEEGDDLYLTFRQASRISEIITRVLTEVSNET